MKAADLLALLAPYDAEARLHGMVLYIDNNGVYLCDAAPTVGLHRDALTVLNFATVDANLRLEDGTIICKYEEEKYYADYD